MPFLRASKFVVALVATLSASAIAAERLPRGEVDDVTLQGNQVTVTGWSMRPGGLARDCEVHFYLDGFPGKGGRFLGSVRADGPRPDPEGILPHLGYDGHGFRYSFALRGKDSSQPHALHVWGVGPEGRPSINLSQSPRLINLARAGAYWDPGMHRAVAATVNPVLPFGFWEVQRNEISGWAIDRDAPHSSVDVHLYRIGPDGSKTFVTAVTAKEPRPDVEAALLEAGVECGGAVGFRWLLPEALAQGQARWEVLAIDSQDSDQYAALERTGTQKTLADLVQQSRAPNTAFYFEAGPPDAEVAGRCWAPGEEGIAPGGGFYTLANDEGNHGADTTGRPKQTCRISPLGTSLAGRQTYYNAAPANTAVACPFEFGWGGDGGRTTATIVVDTRHFPSNVTRNNYLGLQLNLAAGIYAGMPSTPDMTRVIGAEVLLRDIAWNGGREEDRYGRIPYYFTWISYRTGKTYQLSTNLLEFEEGIDVPFIGHTGYYREKGPSSVVVNHISGKYSGLQHPEQDLVQWAPSSDVSCSTPPERMRWRRYTIPIADLVKKLIADAAITGVTEEAMLPDTQGRFPILSNLTIGGIEQFGRTRMRLDVADHVLYLKAPAAR